jgi:hypothetical protein
MRSRTLLAGVAATLLLLPGTAAADGPETTTSTDVSVTAPTVTTATVPVTTTAPATTEAATTTAAEPTTTAPATTAVPTTTAPATTAPATTSATTSTSTPVSTSTPTTTRPARPAAPPARTTRRLLGSGCPLAAVAIVVPGEAPLLVGPAAGSGPLVYPADGSVVRASSVALGESRCGASGPVRPRATLSSVSLFAGAVTAARVALAPGRTGAVAGLRVAGGARTGARRPLGSWGYLVTGAPKPVRSSAGGFALSVLSIHLLREHAGLPAGTDVLVAVAGGMPARPAKHARHRKKVQGREPLKVTPPLALRHYVFPVVGPSDYGDTYGAFRGDVPGNWHHGDDIFAPLGTPVVAVASGTINRVGWEHLGGWRLWVRDSAGDEFYYAHLAGYAPSDLRSNRVVAGQVIGFLGNTGDAFTTAPHLHFEIHPRQLLRLDYDGAVDPTRYLDSWTHLAKVRAPRPAHPPLPAEPVLRKEAAFVWRELLAARHLTPHAPPASRRPHVEIPVGADGRVPVPRDAEAVPAPARHRTHASGSSAETFALAAAIGGVALAASLLLTPFVLRRAGPARARLRALLHRSRS